MTIEIELPYQFDLRPYQMEQYKAMDNGIKRVAKCWHRRAGKDLTDLNYMIKEAVRIKDNYWYVLPEYGQARKAIWDNITKDGRKYLSYIPDALIKRKQEQQMFIELVNGSIIRLIGGDNVDKIVGAGPRGIVMSEYSLHKPSTWQFLEPMILEKDGWAIFNGTPRGHNHFYDLMEMAKDNPRWFRQICTIDDTGVVSPETIDQLREEGRPEETIQQEYYCSFQGSIYGSYYGAAMDKLEAAGRITDDIGYDPALLVYTNWDLGKGDSTAIWFWQISGNQIRVIDYYENHGKDISHYAREVLAKDYLYGAHWAPHDLKADDLFYLEGKTRHSIAKSLGIDFKVTPNIPREDGIEAVRSILPRCWFTKRTTKDGREALKQYRKEYDEKNKRFKDTPLHDWASDGADAFRYLAVCSDQVSSKTKINYNELYQ